MRTLFGCDSPFQASLKGFLQKVTEGRLDLMSLSYRRIPSRISEIWKPEGILDGKNFGKKFDNKIHSSERWQLFQMKMPKPRVDSHLLGKH